MPDAKTVIDKSIEALGGEEALRAVEQMKATGTFSVPAQGLDADMTIMMIDRGDSPLMKLMIDIPGMGSMVQGLTPEGGYASDPMQGTRELTEEELASLREEADFQSDLDLDKYYESYEVTGRQEVDGVPTIAVKFVKKDGKESTVYYADGGEFDGLPVMKEATESTPMGDVPVRSKIGDYREVEGPAGPLMMPFSTEAEFGGQAISTTLSEVDLEPGLTEEDLAPPAEVQEMMGGGE